MRKAEQGFTLIEIIAVLVILGILAAVAVPRFVNLQDESRRKGLQGLVAAAQSQLYMSYAEELLRVEDADTAWTNTSGNASTICGNVSADGWLDDDVTLTCTGGTTEVTIDAVYNPDTTLNATGSFTDPNN